MTTITDILKAAQNRAKEMSLPYEGALLPSEVYELLQRAPGAKLIDVRTQAEWDWVGRVPGAVQIEWMTYPGMLPNETFMQELAQQVDKESMVMFMCRSGARSHHAAMAATEAGFRDSYNVLEGFEGDKDDDKHRASTGGWKAAGLPWVQN